MISRVYLEFEFLVPNADQFKWTTSNKKAYLSCYRSKGKAAATTTTANRRMGTEMCEWTHKNIFFLLWWRQATDAMQQKWLFFCFLLLPSSFSFIEWQKKNSLLIIFFTTHFATPFCSVRILHFCYNIHSLWCGNILEFRIYDGGKNEIRENQLFRKCYSFFVKLTLKYN